MMVGISKYLTGDTNRRLYKGDSESSDYGTTNSTYDPAQSDFYTDLLNRSQSWMNNGGMETSDYSNQMQDILTQQGDVYSEMMQGGYDQTALNNAMNANAQQATQSFERNVIPTLTTNANMAGQAGSSRSGIAEGLAASDLNQQISNQNASMIWDAEQNAMARQAAGAQGMTGLLSGYNQLSQYQNQLNNSDLESLLTYKGLIDGNYGGSENTVKTGETSAGTAAGFI